MCTVGLDCISEKKNAVTRFGWQSEIFEYGGYWMILRKYGYFS